MSMTTRAGLLTKRPDLPGSDCNTALLSCARVWGSCNALSAPPSNQRFVSGRRPQSFLCVNTVDAPLNRYSLLGHGCRAGTSGRSFRYGREPSMGLIDDAETIEGELIELR